MTKPRTQLIFLWNYVEWGGAQIFLLAIMKAARADWDILVVLPRGSMPTILYFLDDLGIRYEFLDVAIQVSEAPGLIDKIRRQWRRIFAEAVSLKYLMRFDLKNSILHIETAPWQSWLLLTALAMRRAHVFVTMHNFMPRSSKLREMLWRLRLRFVSGLPGFHIIPSNQDTKDKLRGWVRDVFWEKMIVAHTAIDPTEIDAALESEFVRSETRMRHGIDPDNFIVLCVGQFIDRKGRWVFLDAAKQVIDKDPDVAFVWLTPKLPDEAENARIVEYGLRNSLNIVLSDSVGKAREDVLRFFRVADVFTLPSYVEGLPIALLEAMALNIPSISTRVYAIPEAIKDMETGILIDAGDSEGLADSILRLKRDPELREKLAGNGRKFVLENFDERVVAGKVIDSYKRSLEGK